MNWAEGSQLKKIGWPVELGKGSPKKKIPPDVFKGHVVGGRKNGNYSESDVNKGAKPRKKNPVEKKKVEIRQGTENGHSNMSR